MNRLRICSRKISPTSLIAAALLMIILLFGVGLAIAQSNANYDLTWWTVDGGGHVSITGGPYTLLSGAGQPEAGPAVSSGNYTLQSGFWPSKNPLHLVYLPIVVKPDGPDLVGSFTLNPAGPNFNAGQAVVINAVVTNQGNVPASAFWVDFYINPAATPSVNHPWNSLCGMTPCYGLAWYVSGGLGPGQSINLTSTPSSYAAGYSIWPGYFAAGTSHLHLYVDSWNPGVGSGGVFESREDNNLYSLPGGVIVTGMTTAVEVPAPDSLPDRPVRY